MLTIKCNRCKRKVFRYLKIGKGQVLRCYKSRITRDFSTREGSNVRCSCGNLIGIDEGNRIRMRRSAFFHTGTKVNRS